MPFRPPKKPPQFADLKGILAQTRETENPLYQTVGQIIDRLTRFHSDTTQQIAAVVDRVDQIKSGNGNGNLADMLPPPVQGEVGPIGPIGPVGPAGPPGVDGEDGATGPKGDTGDQGVQGIQGIQGPQGEQGIQGIEGPVGPSADTFAYRADIQSQSTGSDPGTGRMRWNTVDQLLATELAFDRVTDDGFDATVVLQLTHQHDEFLIQDADLAINHQVWRQLAPAVIMGGDWFTVPVELVSSSGAGSFSHLQALAVIVKTAGVEGPAGPVGPIGPPGPEGPQGVQGIQGVKGDTGLTGQTGDTGATGATGPQGEKGDKGDKGDQGEVGPAGSGATLPTATINQVLISQGSGVQPIFSPDPIIGKVKLIGVYPQVKLSTTGYPVIQWEKLDQPNDQKIWRQYIGFNEEFHFDCLNDVEDTVISTPLLLHRAGIVDIQTALAIGSNPARSGTIGLSVGASSIKYRHSNNGDYNIAEFNPTLGMTYGAGGFPTYIFGPTTHDGALGVINGSVSIGTNPAQSGALRLANDEFIKSRNESNTGDINLIRATAGGVNIGEDAATVRIMSGNLYAQGGPHYMGGGMRLANHASLDHLDPSYTVAYKSVSTDVPGNIILGQTGHPVVVPETVSIGTNPAQSGALRLANSQYIKGRNDTNTGDVDIALVTGGNNLALGGTNVSNINLSTASLISLLFNSANVYAFSSNSFAPYADNAKDIGNAGTNRFRHGYFGGNVEAGGLGSTPLNATNLTSGTVPDARLSVNVLKHTGGYPGGSTNFLRADGTFSPPPTGGTPGPHGSTHTIGGGDTIPNVAWTNVANPWSVAQIFPDLTQVRGNNGWLYLVGEGSANDNKVWRFYNPGNGELRLGALNDGVNIIQGELIFTRDGGMQALGGLFGTPLNANQLTSGTVPDARLSANVQMKPLPANIAYTNIDNNFVAQTLGSSSVIQGANSILWFKDTAAGLNLKLWRYVNFSDGPLVLQAVTDDLTSPQTTYSYSRAGVFAAPVIRSTQHWFDPVVPSSNDRTLDDYLEYPWTPALNIAGGIGTLTGTATATMIKVGQAVTLSIRLSIATITGQGAGVVTIEGCPVSPIHACVGTVLYQNLAVAVGDMCIWMNAGSPLIYVFAGFNSGNQVQLAGNYLQGGTSLYISISFRANA